MRGRACRSLTPTSYHSARIVPRRRRVFCGHVPRARPTPSIFSRSAAGECLAGPVVDLRRTPSTPLYRVFQVLTRSLAEDVLASAPACWPARWPARLEVRRRRRITDAAADARRRRAWQTVFFVSSLSSVSPQRSRRSVGRGQVSSTCSATASSPLIRRPVFVIDVAARHQLRPLTCAILSHHVVRVVNSCQAHRPQVGLNSIERTFALTAGRLHSCPRAPIT